MAKIKTLEALWEARKTGKIPDDATLTIDNDTTFVYVPKGPADDPWADSECVFRMHPGEVLEQALDLLDIPHEGV